MEQHRPDPDGITCLPRRLAKRLRAGENREEQLLKVLVTEARVPVAGQPRNAFTWPKSSSAASSRATA
ncbi:MAG TPA: hypothetical protein VE733_07055 [Streptosporangiaceae bacterium]|nr:hypothetical protein [Streptosporangiaceae bacterium]